MHFGVRALNGVQFNGIRILTCGNGRNGTAPHADAVVVAPHHHDLIARLQFFFFAVFFFAEANATGQHNHFVVTELPRSLYMLECEYTAAD